jgi:hypothetical protein
MKTSLWNKRISRTGSGNSSGIPKALKVILTICVIIGTLGCSISDVIQNVVGSLPTATSAPAMKPTDTTVPDSPTVAPSFTPQPTFTDLPTYTEQPTYTLLPTYPPLPTYTPFPSLTPEVIYLPPSPYPTYSYYTGEQCCTLRVRNKGKVLYWIGTKMPWGGNYIEPGWYVDFKMHQKTFMWIEFCRVWLHNGKLHDCKKRYVYLDEYLEEISIP